jgi:hypothetical protein
MPSRALVLRITKSEAWCGDGQVVRAEASSLGELVLLLERALGLTGVSLELFDADFGEWHGPMSLEEVPGDAAVRVTATGREVDAVSGEGVSSIAQPHQTVAPLQLVPQEDGGGRDGGSQEEVSSAASRSSSRSSSYGGGVGGRGSPRSVRSNDSPQARLMRAEREERSTYERVARGALAQAAERACAADWEGLEPWVAGLVSELQAARVGAQEEVARRARAMMAVSKMAAPPS